MNSGSFEQITTSRLIEKTGGLIKLEFTHIAQRSLTTTNLTSDPKISVRNVDLPAVDNSTKIMFSGSFICACSIAVMDRVDHLGKCPILCCAAQRGKSSVRRASGVLGSGRYSRRLKRRTSPSVRPIRWVEGQCCRFDRDCRNREAKKFQDRQNRLPSKVNRRVSSTFSFPFQHKSVSPSSTTSYPP